MSNSNGNSGPGKQSIPQITTFQFSNDAVGQIKDSVNLYTGTSNIPINIASLPGRKDLDVNIGIMYNSNVQNNVQNWNLSNPTGIIGLGWDMSFDKIIVNKNGSGTATSDEYYLLSNGSGNRLVQDAFVPASPANIQLFQTRNFEFWDIRYDPGSEKWTIIKEDGTVFIYGDKNSGRNTLQYGVAWGNWLGNSSVPIGQEQYVTSWNLSEIQNVWGEKVTYSYDNVQVKSGSTNGLEYTQASYLKGITDSFNRTITFNYDEKYGAKNPGTQNIVEYQAKHTQASPYNSYQEQYETRYLHHIDVQNSMGIQQFSILFEYDFVNLGISNQTTVYPLMWKRVLTSFWQVQPDGKSLPGMEFEYYTKYEDINAGALKAVTYPQGARAKYVYKNQLLNTSRNKKLDSPLQGAIPRVWFGPDYTVISWYNATTKTLRAMVYSWCGNWITFEMNSDEPASRYFDNVDFNIDTLGVIIQQDFIALYFTEKSKKQVQLFLYRRNPENFGVFNLSGGPRYLPVKTGTAITGISAGKDFVIAFGKDFTTTPITAFQWNWKRKRWDTTPANNPAPGNIQVLLPSPADVAKATNLFIAARDNYYIAALYNQTSKLLQFQFFYRDGNNTWSKSSLYSTSNVKIYQDPDNKSEFPFSLSLSNAFAVATYVTDISTAEVSYSLRILQWDKNFALLSPSTPLVNNYKSPVTGSKSQFSVFNTILTDSLISNNPYLNRYTGGTAQNNNPLSWKKASFITKPADNVSFAPGQDISIMSVNQGAAATNQYYQFNPDTGIWDFNQNLGSAGTYPTVSGNYITAGKDIFYQNTNGQWIKQQQQLNNLQAPETVQNRGASYIAYQDNTSSNAKTYFACPKNGIPGNPQPLPTTTGGTGQKIFVQQDAVKAGTLLAGSDSFVTYPANEDFETATSLALYKVAGGKASDIMQVTPVAYIEISNQFNPADNYYQSYEYARSAKSIITYDPQSSLAQFPKVSVVTGSKIPTGSAPAGISISYFSNGVAEQSAIPYPSNWVYNFNMLLNGTLLQKEQYNKKGELVSSETNYWQVFQDNIVQGNYLFGAFFRLSKSLIMKDGVSQDTSLTYFQDIGLQQSHSTSYVDSAGETKTVVSERKYAIHIDAYKQAMEQKHLLNAIAQDVVSVTGENDEKKYISSTATTWKNWANDGSWKWATFQNYQWLGPAEGNPVFDFSENAQKVGWLKKQEVISRRLPYSLITEMVNVDGMATSYIYDKEARFQIAEFPDASRSGDEASYYSFEKYEMPDKWQMGNNAEIIPNSNNMTIDAQMGIHSLKMSLGTGIQRQFTPRNQDQDYVFSCYIKLPDGFDVGKGTANWVISFTKNGSPAGNDIILPFGQTIGSWQYVYCIISPKDINSNGSDGLITISIKAKNENTVSSVLVDCLRFSPLPCLFAGVSLDPKTNIVDAALGANGEIRRKFFDSFQRIIATTGFSGETTSMATSYFSRTGNDNQFSVTDPNSKLKVLSAGGGPALSFKKGDEWMQYWTPVDGSEWKAEGGILKLESFQTRGGLTYKGNMTNRYGVLAKVAPTKTVTQPMGIQVGAMFTVQWQPSTAQWDLLDASGTVLQQKKVYQFTLANTDLGNADLLVAQMRPKLLRCGVDISSTKASLKSTATGIYDADYNQHFALQTNGTDTGVSGIGNQWSLLVNENSLFFFVDGELVFNYVSATTINGVATLFAGDKIALECLLTSFDNQITFTSINGAGNDLQSQLLENTRLTVVENIYDNLGRIIAYTKPAFITAAQTPLFQYIEDFVKYNPTDGSMAGFIADFYPDDGGYPYFGTRYEASPLGRVEELSMPGIDYKMGAHTETIAYSTNDDSLGLPAGEFFQKTVVDQNGNLVYSLSDKRGQEVRKLSQKSSNEEIVAAVFYDDAGNTIELRSPNYKEGDPDNTNWITFCEYNFLGQLTGSVSNNSGKVDMVYDPANRLRFRQDAEAALQGNYQYYKYDTGGRIIETGYLTGNWDRDQLQKKANTDPAFPATPKTWRRQTFYDYNGTSGPFQIGQVVKTLNNHTDNGEPDVEENFVYDVFGNVKSRNQKVVEFDNNYYTTDFKYNNLGGITQIDYPSQNADTAQSVFYQYNSIGQITGIGNQASQPDNLCAYTYNPAGKPEEEILNKYAVKPLKRSYTYNSPVWLEQIQDMNGQDELFHETLKTAATTPGGPTYYNGQSAEISFRYPRGISSDSVYTNWYNGLNALQQVDETSSFKSSVSRKYSFDHNGNFDTLEIGDSSYQYIGEPDKGNRLQSVKDKSNNEFIYSFESNLNGAVESYKASGNDGISPQDLGFTYDPGSRMTTVVNDKINSKTFNLYYGSSNNRVLKKELSDNTVNSSTLYINSLSGNTLVKFNITGGKIQYTDIIYGPTGIVGFIKDGMQYNTLKDHLGSVRVIVDENAAVVAAYDYDLYGNLSVLKEPEPDFFPYLYCSQELDFELGIYNYKARFYFSTVGRFGVPDNYNQFYSPYIYAGNSPLIYVDPSGNFSIGNFFSAIGGAIIGAFEILIGVAIDAIAGILEVVTGGLSTPASVGLAMLAGAFIGSGVSAVSYSAVSLVTNDFSWKDYGINTAIGFVAGAITAGFGATGAIVAEAATGVKAAAQAGEAVSTLAKVANSGIKAGFTIAGAEVAATTSSVINNAANGQSLTTGLGDTLVMGVLSSSLSHAIPAIDYKSGWGNLLKRVASNVAKSESIGITLKIGSNAVHGDSLDIGLLNTVVKGVVSGSIGGLKTKDFAKEYTKESANFMNFESQNQPPADGIIRL